MDGPSGRHGTGHSARTALLADIRGAWPLEPYTRAPGYPPILPDGLSPIDALPLTDTGPTCCAVVAARNEEGAIVALPIVRESGQWRIADAGDGTTSALLDVAGAQALAYAASLPVDPSADGFEIHSSDPNLRGGTERALGTDQSNLSVVVDDRIIVKWRTSVEADGARGLLLRRHLEAAAFAGVPRHLGSVTWASSDGTEALVDIDAYLPGAEDGWEYCIDLLRAWVDSGSAPEAADLLGIRLGELIGGLHVALAEPSEWVPDPRKHMPPETRAAWHQAAVEVLGQAVETSGDAKEVVSAAQPKLRAEIDLLEVDVGVDVQPVHGDLHIGQLVAWEGGIAVIDFDGPRRRDLGSSLKREPTARDVAQLLCSLDMLAVAVDRRTNGTATPRLRDWAARTRLDFLEAYEKELARAGQAGLFDANLLRPLMAEQLCRELLYAEAALPRWRYAPVGVLRWMLEEDPAS